MDNSNYQAAMLRRLEHDLAQAQRALAVAQVGFVNNDPNVSLLNLKCAEIDVRDIERAIDSMCMKGSVS